MVWGVRGTGRSPGQRPSLARAGGMQGAHGARRGGPAEASRGERFCATWERIFLVP
jgi:hypothetical protein